MPVVACAIVTLAMGGVLPWIVTAVSTLEKEDHATDPDAVLLNWIPPQSVPGPVAFDWSTIGATESPNDHSFPST